MLQSATPLRKSAPWPQVEWKNRKTHWHEAATALNFPFLKEVSQNCFVFDVVNFANWESLEELFRFWRCQIQKLRTSRKIAALSSLQIDRLIERQLQLQLQVPLHDTSTTTTSTNILRYITQHELAATTSTTTTTTTTTATTTITATLHYTTIH